MCHRHSTTNKFSNHKCVTVTPQQLKFSNYKCVTVTPQKPKLSNYKCVTVTPQQLQFSNYKCVTVIPQQLQFSNYKCVTVIPHVETINHNFALLIRTSLRRWSKYCPKHVVENILLKYLMNIIVHFFGKLYIFLSDQCTQVGTY